MTAARSSRGDVAARVWETRRERTACADESHPPNTSASVEPGPEAHWIAAEDGRRCRTGDAEARHTSGQEP